MNSPKMEFEPRQPRLPVRANTTDSGVSLRDYDVTDEIDFPVLDMTDKIQNNDDTTVVEEIPKPTSKLTFNPNASFTPSAGSASTLPEQNSGLNPGATSFVALSSTPNNEISEEVATSSELNPGAAPFAVPSSTPEDEISEELAAEIVAQIDAEIAAELAAQVAVQAAAGDCSTFTPNTSPALNPAAGDFTTTTAASSTEGNTSPSLNPAAGDFTPTNSASSTEARPVSPHQTREHHSQRPATFPGRRANYQSQEYHAEPADDHPASNLSLMISGMERMQGLYAKKEAEVEDLQISVMSTTLNNTILYRMLIRARVGVPVQNNEILKTEHIKEIADLKTEHLKEMGDLQEKHDEEIKELKEEHAEAMKKEKMRFDVRVQLEVNRQREKDMALMREEVENRVRRAFEAKAEKQLAELKAEYEEHWAQEISGVLAEATASKDEELSNITADNEMNQQELKDQCDQCNNAQEQHDKKKDLDEAALFP